MLTSLPRLSPLLAAQLLLLLGGSMTFNALPRLAPQTTCSGGASLRSCNVAASLLEQKGHNLVSNTVCLEGKEEAKAFLGAGQVGFGALFDSPSPSQTS